MTEDEWLAASDAAAMLAFVRNQASDRKLRLFTVSCCRLFWDFLPLDGLRESIVISERYADGQATDKELSQARYGAHTAAWWARYPGVSDVELGDDATMQRFITECRERPSEESLRRPFFVAFMSNSNQRLRTDPMPMLTTDPLLAGTAPALLRDIFGNPFRAAPAQPEWLTSTVLALAREIYDNHAFELLPILADALQDAGCDDDILNHCRSSGPHTRGCWVVDLLLGKH